MGDETTETFQEASGETEVLESDASRKRKKFHFSVEMDVRLLELTLDDNPYETPNKDRMQSWKTIAQHLEAAAGTEGILPRTCKDRVERLLSYFDEDHPCIKQAGMSNDANGMIQHRLSLLEVLSKSRRELTKDGSIPVVPRRVFRRAEASLLPKSTVETTAPLTYHYTTVPLNGLTGVEEAEIRAAISNGFTHGTSAGDEDVGTLSKHEHSPGFDSGERSLLRQLLDARKLEENRRMQELDIRREEIQTERLKLDLERQKWEEDRKERQDRFLMEQEERKVILELLKKSLLMQNSTEHIAEIS